MNIRLQLGLIIVAMVTLCMSALPESRKPDLSTSFAGLRAAPLTLTLPISSELPPLRLSVSAETLQWIGSEVGAAMASECIAEGGVPVSDVAVTTDLAESFSPRKLLGDLDMPFFSFAGLMGGANSK